MKTLTYNNDPKFKADFVQMAKLHREQDRYATGTYATGKGDSFKGCSVGCSVRSLKLLGRYDMGYDDHAALAAALAWPEWLVRLQDAIFEGLPAAARGSFTENLADAVPLGGDIEPVRWKFCAFLLNGNIDRVLALGISDALRAQVVAAIRQCLIVNENAILTGSWEDSAAYAARSAAYAARSAAYAARSAAYAADAAACSAADAADAAAYAARSAAYAADAAASSAAYAADSAADSASSAAYAADPAYAAAYAAYSAAAFSSFKGELLRLLQEV